MRMRKMGIVFLVLVISLSLLTGCGANEETAKSQKGVTTIEFWTAPNPPQQKYWEQMARQFEKENPDIRVIVTPMRETPSSEAYVISSLIGKKGPTIAENITRGFAAQLAESKVLEPINRLKDLRVMQTRNMDKTMDAWRFPDGNQYVIPVYSNAMLFGWRIDILREIGYDQPPRTYSEMIDAAKKLKARYPNKFIWAKADLADPTSWKRWFDFFMLYDAASNGNDFVQGNRFVGDKEAGKKVFQLMLDLHRENGLLAKQVKDPFESGVGIFADLGPWTFSYWMEKFPEMKLNKTFVLAPPPVPDNMKVDHPRTFADSKGIVLFSQKPEAEKRAAIRFLNWVYQDPKHDLALMEMTSLPAARDDLLSNKTFQPYFEKNPALKAYAGAVPYGVPAMANAKYNNIQTIIGQEAFNKVVKGQKSAEQAWADMKEEIEKELVE
ncbi:extracellular solute-binding protein [Paenactinomyces guangxiensis]|uniref:Extracellular solute-binding protein n=1 Tax=Paenactinomyces guangxiensis TaxID=1490290 RepID=A0A7W1WP81_9BACL|nr:extracellular solute-binding protein [Paenactinomyces guangxiensis]MBA4493527.1 extracellular solute-binding protein [Paenactinomyces guangxiensis]MBH8590618.1 extracellular solute-binding protein [Paenactinomyces guangxiensis]